MIHELFFQIYITRFRLRKTHKSNLSTTSKYDSGNTSYNFGLTKSTRGRGSPTQCKIQRTIWNTVLSDRIIPINSWFAFAYPHMPVYLRPSVLHSCSCISARDHARRVQITMHFDNSRGVLQFYNKPFQARVLSRDFKDFFLINMFKVEWIGHQNSKRR